MVPEKQKKPQSKKPNVLKYIGFFIFLLSVFIIFRFAVEITIVSGNSMNPTLKNHDVLFTNKLLFQENRGDLVIFDTGNGFNAVKRVIGLPGEDIMINQGFVYIDGDKIEEDYTVGTSVNMKEITIPPDHYFLAGDNRVPGESLDSRSESVGFISRGDIRGEILISLWPFHTT